MNKKAIIDDMKNLTGFDLNNMFNTKELTLQGIDSDIIKAAIDTNNNCAMKFFVNSGVDFFSISIDEKNVYQYLMINNKVEMFSNLIQNNKSNKITSFFDKINDLLSFSVNGGLYESVDLLLQNGGNAKCMTKSGQPMIWVSASLNDHRTMKLLLANDADPNAKDKIYGWTPLMWAGKNNDKISIDLLFAGNKSGVKADVELRNREGKLAVTVAKHYGNNSLECKLATKRQKSENELGAVFF